MNTKDRVPFYVNACDELGIEVLPPDVNSSADRLRGRRGEDPLRPERGQERGRDGGAARSSARARRAAAFESIWDFTERVDPQVVNKRSLESLVKCGALDSTGASRMGMLAVLEQALASRAEARAGPADGPVVDLRRRLRRGRQLARTAPPADPDRRVREAGAPALEKETLGLYVSEHPLSSVREQLRRKTDATLSELERRRDGEVVTVGGIVSDVKQLTTKRGDPMVFLTLDDPTGDGEVVVFNSTYAAARELCVTDRILVIKGRIDHKQQGETKLLALGHHHVRGRARAPEVRFSLDAREAPAGVIRELARLVREFPGESPVYLSLDTSRGPEDATPSAPSTASAPTRTSSPRRGPCSAGRRSSPRPRTATAPLR